LPIADSRRTDSTNGTGDRWASVGQAVHGDARTCVAMAYGQLDLPETPQLLLMFVAPTLDREDVVAAIAELAPGVAVVGCTSGGEITSSGVRDGSVVLVALGGRGIRCSTSWARIVGGDARAAASAAATAVAGLDRDESTVMMVLADGADIDQDDLVRGVYDVVGAAVPLVGGCACGEVLQRHPGVFHLDAVDRSPGSSAAGDGIVAVAAITSNGPIGVGVGHGFDPTGEPKVVTSSGRNVVLTLDERPALDSYLAHHGADDSIFDAPGGFDEFAICRPLGVARRGRIEPRGVIGADRVRRSLHTGAPVPQGGMVWMMATDPDAALAAVDTAADQALGRLDGRAPIAVVAFDCAGRRGVLGPDGVDREVARLVGRAGAPVAGLYTFGEIARTTGSTGFHNLTAVLLAFG